VVYQDVTRQAKGLYRLKHVGALGSGLAYLSRYNSGWFCHKHTVATSARRRPAPLTPRPTAGPSRSPAPRVSAFRRTPELHPQYGHHVPASCATAFHRNSSCACRCSARRTPAVPARAHGPALLRPPNTCTHRQLPRATARTLTSPATRASPVSSRARSLHPRSPAVRALHSTRAPPAPLLLCRAARRLLTSRSRPPHQRSSACVPAAHLHRPRMHPARLLPLARPALAPARRSCAPPACIRSAPARCSLRLAPSRSAPAEPRASAPAVARPAPELLPLAAPACAPALAAPAAAMRKRKGVAGRKAKQRKRRRQRHQ
jgi:hypothetical protein